MRFPISLPAKAIGFLLVCLLGCVAPASAASIVSTYTGTVSTGVDPLGIFGKAGANLAGLGYKLVFTTDTVAGQYSTFDSTSVDPSLPGGQGFSLSGDQVFGGMSAVLTINGANYALNGAAATSGNYFIVAHEPGLSWVAQQIGSPSTFVTAWFQSTNPGPGFPTSVLSSASLAGCASGGCSAALSFAIDGLQGISTRGTLNFGTFASSVVATPIPSTLPLLVSALGSVAFLGWRRRKAKAA